MKKRKSTTAPEGGGAVGRVDDDSHPEGQPKSSAQPGKTYGTVADMSGAAGSDANASQQAYQQMDENGGGVGAVFFAENVAVVCLATACSAQNVESSDDRHAFPPVCLVFLTVR